MTLPPIVKVQFVDLETQNNVYPGLTATLKDMRTKMMITLIYPPNADVDSAIVTIARKDGSEKGKQYDLNLGQNVIGHLSDDTAHIKHLFEINVSYTVKIGVDLYNGDKYVSEFTHGAKSNESSYSDFIYRDPENLDKFSVNPTEFTLLDHGYFEEDGTIKISCRIDFKESLLDPRKPISVGFTFDEVDNYPGTANDSDNTEQTAAYINVPYQGDGQYEFLVGDLRGSLKNDSVYNALVTAKYVDGHQIQQTLDDNVHMIINPLIVVESYGLGPDRTGAGELNTSTAAILYVQKDTIGVSASNIPAQDSFTLKFSQNGEDKYTAQLTVSEGILTTRNFDGGNKYYWMYSVLNSGLTEVGTAVAEDDGTHIFDAQIFARYNTLPGTRTAILEKPSNTVSGTYVNDYTPLEQVDLFNAWVAATNVVSSGEREINMAVATTINGYAVAPDIGIVGSFYKTAHFGSGSDGFLKDLDVTATMFKYEICVTNGDEGEVETWQPVKKIHQILGTVGNTPQDNYIEVINAPEQADPNGEYANIPGAAGTSGPVQPAVYFRICMMADDLMLSEDQIVKVRVTIVPEGKTTDVGSKESAMCVVVKKITRYIMTPNTLSEPMFANEVLRIPINAEEDADLNFHSARFQSNLAYPHADIHTQTDAEDVVVNNPSKRGVGANNAINYTVTYKIHDPNTGGTVSIESEEYTINVTDEHTFGNYSVTNYEYNTFHNDSESSFAFDVSFTDGATTGIDGIDVYFHSSNDDQDNLNDIAPMLVLNVPRTNGDSQSNLSVMLQDTPASNSDASSSIKVNDIDGNDSAPWLNYRSGTISFVPYKSPRVFGSIIDGDVLIQSNDPEVVDTKLILNIPVIDMPENVLLVGGVVESHTGTRLEWLDNRLEYSNTSVTPSYELVDNDVVVPQHVMLSVDSADSSKLSHLVNAAPALSSLKFEIRTKLVSDVDSTTYYSKPVTVEFTSASVDLSGASAVVRRGSNVTTLKAMLNAYAATDASDIETPTGITVFVEPNFVAPTSGWLNPSYVLPPGDYNDTALAILGLNDHVKSMLIPAGYTVQAWRNNFSGTTATYTSSVAQTISSVSSLRITGAPVGFPKLSNLNVTELALVNVGQTDNKCVSKQNGVQTLLTDAQIDGVIADSSRSIITIDPEVCGWSVKNTYAVNATRPKVNLYYYGNNAVAAVSPPAPNGEGLDESNSFNLSQAAGLGLYARFYQNPGAKEYPFFNAYTARTSSGTNKSWYKSKVFYGSESSGDTTTDSDKVGLTLVYTGTDDGLLFPEITRRVKYVVKVGSNLTNANVPGYENEPVWLLSLQTSGAATSSSESYNFRLLETGMFTSHNSFGQLSLRYNVVSDPESPAVKVLSSSTTDAVQAVGTIHTYNLSQDGYNKSDILQLLARMKAGVDYTEKRGDAIAAAKESQPMYLSLVSGAKMAYACASSPSVEVVGTRSFGTGVFENRKVIDLKLNANGLEREGIQSVIIHLLKEGNHTDEDADAQGAEIVLGFESTSGRVRSYTVNENGADVITGSTDNLGAGETHELTIDNVVGFSETALPNTSTFHLVMGTLDDNDASKLYLPVGSEWDIGDVMVLAVASTRLGTDVHYGTVSDTGLD